VHILSVIQDRCGGRISSDCNEHSLSEQKPIDVCFNQSSTNDIQAIFHEFGAFHSKKIPVLGDSIPVLGVKLKPGYFPR